MSAFYDLASLVLVPSGYKASKVYAQKPLTTDGQLTFSRASTATRVNSAGLIETVSSNVPRLDYLNSTCPKLNLEPQRTNWVPYSERLELGYAFAYVDGLTITQNTTETLDPFGNNAAEKFQTTTGGKRADSYSGALPGLQQLHSIFAKAGTANSITIECLGASGTQFAATFNLTNGTVSSTSGTPTVSGVQSYGNGWYRCYVGGIGSTSAHVKGLVVNGTGSVYFFGWMWEEGNYPTTYIATTAGAAVTRLADACSKTGISSLIGQTEGTMYAEFTVNGFADYGTPLCINNGGTNESIWLTTFGNGNIRAEIFSATTGGVQATFTKTGNVVGQTYKIALAYAQHNSAFFVNGVQVGTTDTSCNVPVGMSRVDFDYVNPALFTQSALNIKQALLFKTRLTNAQLAELTAL